MDYALYELAITLKNDNHLLTIQDTDEIFLYDFNEKIYAPAETGLKTTIQLKIGSEATTHKVNEVLNAIRRMTYVSREDLEMPLNLIPLKNNIYDFQKNELIEYSPKHLFFKKHPIKLDEIPIETNNEISQWVDSVVDTQENEVLLKELAGYCFYRAMPFQNLFLLVGSGANGKSVWLNLLQKMLGEENVSGISLQQLANPNDRFSAGELHLKNANIFGDLSSKSLSDTGMIKQLTGNDSISCERKFKSHFKFRNYAKLIASCNSVPESPEYTDAWVRRPVIISFPYSFVGKEDRNLFERISTPENLSLFFVECINAFKDALKANNLIRNETLEEKKRMYLLYSNSATAFIEEKMEYEPELRISTETIYKKYGEYCVEHKLVKKDERGFFMTLYKVFNHKLYKKREQVAGVREHYIYGVTWVEEKKKESSPVMDSNVKKILGFIKEKFMGFDAVPTEEIIEAGRGFGLTPDEVMDLIGELQKAGEVYAPRYGFFKPVSFVKK